MNELYLEMENKKERIDDGTVEKYHLESGTILPLRKSPS
jgi:hypothetical protein